MAEQSNIQLTPASATLGLNLDSSIAQIENTELTFALNAILENFDGQSISYSNEPANEFCCQFPSGYQVNGSRNIIEEDIILVWLVNSSTGDSEIGTVEKCQYNKKINSKCIGLDVNFPILKTAHFKTNCNLYVFWVDGKNKSRYIDLYNLPFKQIVDGCNTVTTTEVDC